jgi:hypothetical protein
MNNIPDLYNIEIAPEYWIMSSSSAIIMGITFFLFLLFACVTAKFKGFLNHKTEEEAQEIDQENENSVAVKVE